MKTFSGDIFIAQNPTGNRDQVLWYCEEYGGAAITYTNETEYNFVSDWIWTNKPTQVTSAGGAGYFTGMTYHNGIS